MDTRRRRTRNQNEELVSRRTTAAATASLPVKRSSPARNRASPVRRSSRSRSSLQPSVPAAKKSAAPAHTPIKEVKEPKSPKPHVGTPISTASYKDVKKEVIEKQDKSATSTKTIHSSFSETTQKTVEIRSGDILSETDINKIADYLRRSASKSVVTETNSRREGTHTPTTNTGSRYSRSVSHSVYDDDNFSKTEYSDDEQSELQERDTFRSLSGTQSLATSAYCRKVEAPREFGGWIGALFLLITVPCLVFYTQWTCSKTSCHFKQFNITKLLNQDYFGTRLFNPQAVGAYLCFNIGIFGLTVALFGRRVRLPLSYGYAEYKFNALPIAVVVTIAAGVAEYLNYGVADFVLKHYLRFCIYGLFNAFVVASWCLMRSRWMKRVDSAQTNVYGASGNIIIDYALGRQLNPKWLGFVEFKQAFYRISLITTLLYVECLLYKNIQVPWLPVGKEGALNIIGYYLRNTNYDAGALLAALLLLVYILDAIIFEHHLASSFELQGEGFGCLLLLRYATTPYLLMAVPKYFYEHHTEINCQYAIYVPVVLLVCGLVLKRLSSAVKYKYRINPLHPIFSGIETIHTFQGKRLLLGGFWGRLRQPNYAGDILALIALATPLGLRFAWPPLVGIILLIAHLLHRTRRVSQRNIARYHSSWVRYCTRVPYYVVPKVF